MYDCPLSGGTRTEDEFKSGIGFLSFVVIFLF